MTQIYLKPDNYTRLIVGGPMALELGWSTRTSIGSAMHALANSRRSLKGGSPRRRGRGLAITLLGVAAIVFSIPILLKGGAMVGDFLQDNLSARFAASTEVSADAPAVPTDEVAAPAQVALSTTASPSNGATAPLAAGAVLPPIPLPLLASATPPPAPIGELVHPQAVAKPKGAQQPSASVKVHGGTKGAEDAPASVVIDVGAAAKPKAADKPATAAAAASKPTSPIIVKSDEPKAQKVQTPVAASRPTELAEAVVSLPAPEVKSSQVQQRPVGEGQKFAQPRSERGVGVTGPGADSGTSRTQSSAPVGRITIVDIAQDGRTVLVTDPVTRLPKKFTVGDLLPNGSKLQSIDPSRATISAGGITYEME